MVIGYLDPVRKCFAGLRFGTLVTLDYRVDPLRRGDIPYQTCSCCTYKQPKSPSKQQLGTEGLGWLIGIRLQILAGLGIRV